MDLVAEGLKSDDAEVRTPEAATLLYRYERALLTKQKRIDIERRNAVDAGELLKAEDVRARVLAIATELRRGHETIARAVDRAAGENRDAVRAEFEAAFGTMRKRIVQALRGST